jgi:hypothetical protein
LQQWRFPDVEARRDPPQTEQLQNAVMGLTAFHKVVPGHVQGMAGLLIGIFLDAENKKGIYETGYIDNGSDAIGNNVHCLCFCGR